MIHPLELCHTFVKAILSYGQQIYKLPAFVTKNSSPLGIFRANRSMTIICYEGKSSTIFIKQSFGSDFFLTVVGLYIELEGNPIAGARYKKIVRWEFLWKKVVFVPPFVFGFGSKNSIEVRNVITGALVQIIELNGRVHFETIPKTVDFRDERGDFFKKWDEDEARRGTVDATSGDDGVQLSSWGPVFLTTLEGSEPFPRVVQLTPRSHPKFLDAQLFDIEVKDSNT